MSSEIQLVPFEEVWTEATIACVFFIVLGGLRGSRRVLEKLSTMMLPDDTLKAYNASNRTEFMW